MSEVASPQVSGAAKENALEVIHGAWRCLQADYWPPWQLESGWTRWFNGPLVPRPCGPDNSDTIGPWDHIDGQDDFFVVNVQRSVVSPTCDRAFRLVNVTLLHRIEKFFPEVRGVRLVVERQTRRPSARVRRQYETPPGERGSR
jgi:hypothetical protein